MATTELHFRCFYCKVGFSTEAALRFHKAQALEEDEPEIPHWWCRLHDKDYHSPRAYHMHMKQFHPKEQELDCPGCGKLFTRLGSLIAHIDKNECPKATQEDILTRRHDMASFARRLDALNGLALEACDRMNQHFEMFLIEPPFSRAILEPDMQSAPSRSSSGPMQALEAPETDSSHQTVAATQSDPIVSDGVSVAVGAEASNTSAAPGTDWSVNTQQSSVSDLEMPWKGDTSGWYGNGKSTPDEDDKDDMAEEGDSVRTNVSEHTEYAPVPLQPAKQPSVAVPGIPEKVCINPASPSYNVEKFREPVTGRYICPHGHCSHPFRVPEGLSIHLKNRICAQPRYLCPACGHRFHSTTALTQHVETTIRCPIKHTGNTYRELLDMLTGGIVDTDGYHEDNTRKYMVQSSAKAALGPEPNPPKTMEEEMQHRKEIREWAEKTKKERRAQLAASAPGYSTSLEKIRWADSNTWF